MPTAEHYTDQIHKEQDALAALFSERKQPDGTYELSAEEVESLQRRNADLAELGKKRDGQAELERMDASASAAVKDADRIRRPMAPEGPGGPAESKVRPLREVFASKAAELKAIASGGRGSVTWQLTEAEAKVLLTSADIAPQADRQAVVPSAQFLNDVTPELAPGSTDSDTVEFYEETTFTNAAAETAEGTAAPESALDFTLRTFPVQEISTFIPVTRRALDDNAGLQSYVEGRLGHMVNLRRSGQLLTGNGTSPNLRGILNTSGIQTQAKGADPTFDAFFKAMTLVRTTGDAEPTGIIVHAQDWQDIKLTRTVDGIYILGNPSETGPERLWGLTVRVSNSITQNTGLVGAFRTFAQVFRREGLMLEISTEHSTFFTERKAALLAWERLALAVYRPAAFCSVTGI